MEYLKTIKNDLLAYDIGSVQPSIKVTHIAKHPIFIPDDDKLKEFHEFSEAITNKIYINSLENTRLAQLRDTLLPKLMSGEIDVSKVNISADKLSFIVLFTQSDQPGKIGPYYNPCVYWGLGYT